MNQKITGYLLLVLGILIILFSLYSVFAVFKGKLRPYPIFDLPGISLDFSNLVGNEKAQQTAKPQSLKTELINKDVLNQPLNYVAHLLLMGFILNVGFKLASLGVQFLRPIKVNLKKEESQSH